MSHYICPGGCKGVSQEPGTCQATECPRHAVPLMECDCADDKHNGLLEGAQE